jgi:phage gp36-like protein
MYLVIEDYRTQVRGDVLNIITNNDDNVRLDAEAAAQQEMESYLSSRFDLDLVFCRYPEYVTTDTYNTLQRVKHLNMVYEAKQDGITGAWDASKWNFLFYRNHLVTMYLVDLVLYHVYSRLMPQQVPKLRMDRYDMVIGWLKSVAKGDLNPQLPRVKDSDGLEQEKALTYGSGTKFKTRNGGFF